APRLTRRPVPRLVRAGARVAGRGAERDGARLPGVRAHRDAQRLSPVLGGLCATRVPAHPALHGADRAVPPVHRLSCDRAPDPERLGGALHTPSRSTCIGYCLTPHRTVSKPHFLRVLALQALDFVKPLFEKLTFDTVWHWSPDKIECVSPFTHGVFHWAVRLMMPTMMRDPHVVTLTPPSEAACRLSWGWRSSLLLTGM